MTDFIESFRGAMTAAGLNYVGEIVPDGKLHPIKADGDRSEKTWYVLHGDGLPAGAFGDHKRGISERWCFKSHETLTPEERAERDRKWRQQQAERDAEQRRRHDQARVEAQKILDAARPAPDHHPYLLRKRVRAYPGVKMGAWPQSQTDCCLLIPLRTAAGLLATVQAIFPHKPPTGSDKRFLKGGQKKGAFFALGDPAAADAIFVAEGYADAASIMEAADEGERWCAVMAGDAGNLKPVAEALRALYPDKRIVIAADNGRATEGNPGLTKATATAGAIDALLAVPEFNEGENGSDFNDLAALHGIEAVREALLNAKSVQTSRAGKNNKGTSYPSLPSFSVTYSLTLEGLSLTSLTFEVPYLHDYDEKGRPILIESRVAAQFANLLKGRFAFCRESLRWHAFAETHWHAVNGIVLDELVTRMLFAGATEGFKARTVTAILSLLTKGLLPLPESLDARALPFLNGLLNLDARELEPITPDNAPIWCLPYAYDPGADCPTFKAWLLRAVDGDAETLEFLRAWLAALLTGRADLQKFLHLLGPGGTGKGAFTRLAELLVGKHNATITDLRNLEQNRFETAALYGKRLVCITDTSKYGGSVDVFKALTGQDSLRLERKHQQQGATFRFGGLVLLASNEALQTTDYTSALERRRLTVEFTRLVSDAERADWNARGGEDAILHPELPGVANWVLALSRDEVTRRLTNQPRRVVRSNREALRNNNPVADWLIENTIPQPGASVKVGDNRPFSERGRTYYEFADERLYPNYLTWCQRAKREPLALRRFSGLVIDMARSLGADVSKFTSGKGAHLKGLRLRREEEAPHDWFGGDVGSSEGCEGSSEGKQSDNKLIINRMMDVRDSPNFNSYRGGKSSLAISSTPPQTIRPREAEDREVF